MADTISVTQRQLDKLDDSICELGLEVRTVNSLEEKGVLTIAHLLNSCSLSISECDTYKDKTGGLCPCQQAVARTSPRLAPDWKPCCYLPDVTNVGEKTIKDIFAKLAAKGYGRA